MPATMASIRGEVGRLAGWGEGKGGGEAAHTTALFWALPPPMGLNQEQSLRCLAILRWSTGLHRRIRRLSRGAEATLFCQGIYKGKIRLSAAQLEYRFLQCDFVSAYSLLAQIAAQLHRLCGGASQQIVAMVALRLQLRGLPCSRERSTWHVLGNKPTAHFMKVHSLLAPPTSSLLGAGRLGIAQPA